MDKRFLLILIMKYAIAVYIPEHYDLRKEGKTTFNGEIYKVFMPSKHIVINRQETIGKTPTPSKRMLIDKIGFSHYWSYMGKRMDRLENLRKTGEDIEVLSKNNAAVNSYKSSATNITEKNNKMENFRKTGEDIEVLSKNNAEVNSNTSSASENITSTSQVTDNTKTTDIDTTKEKASKVTSFPRPKRKNRNVTSVPYIPRPRIIGRTGKTLVHTTYFCPFFGVITMHSYLD